MDASKSLPTNFGASPLLRWESMSAREQTVWGAADVTVERNPKHAARSADQAVWELRSLKIDEHQFIGPEYDAARCCPELTFDEFSVWYPTAWKIASRNRLGEELDEPEVRRAFETYQRSAADFF